MSNTDNTSTIKYIIFTRTWWAKDPKTKKLIPKASRRTKIDEVFGIQNAIAYCDKWNNEHKAGIYSRKAEFTASHNW